MKKNILKIVLNLLSAALIFSFFSCREPHDDPTKNPVNPDSKTPVTETDTAFNLTSIAFANKMGAGWNLGNTLDAKTDGANTDNLGLNTETSWGIPKTTKPMIKAVKDKGFKTIRIPVSWHNHITDRNGYKIDAAWMARVKEVVDWAIEQDLYVILNIHHDNLKASGMNENAGYAVVSDSTIKANSKDYLNCVWTQIATVFKDYDSHLVFEVLNEPRNVGSSYEWWGSGSDITNANAVIKEYEKTCLDAIRRTSGRNAYRFVMVPPYAASPSLTDGWSLPSDSASDKLIVSVHAYTPDNFALSGNGNSVSTFSTAAEASIKSIFENLKNTYVSNGRGVVMGEASCSDKNNLSARKQWFEAYKRYSSSNSVSVVLWDNMVVYPTGNDVGERHGYLNRNACTWYYEELVDIFVR